MQVSRLSMCFCCPSRVTPHSAARYLSLEIDHAAVACFWNMLGDYYDRDALPVGDAETLVQGAVCRVCALRTAAVLCFGARSSDLNECIWIPVTSIFAPAMSDAWIAIEQIALARRKREFVIVGQTADDHRNFESAPMDQAFLIQARRRWGRVGGTAISEAIRHRRAEVPQRVVEGPGVRSAQAVGRAGRNRSFCFQSNFANELDLPMIERAFDAAVQQLPF